MNKLFSFFLLFVLAGAADAATAPERLDSCGARPAARAREWLQRFSSRTVDAEIRGQTAFCLVRHHLDKPEVASALLAALRDKNEHLFVREDIAQAFRYVSWRKRVAVKADIGTDISQADTQALSRALASVKPIIDATRSVKEITNIVPATKYEREFLETLLVIFADSESHIQFRIAAINSITAMVDQMVESDQYDDGLIRSAHDVIRQVASRQDFLSYYAGAEYGLERFGKLLARLGSERPDHPLVRELASTPAAK